MDRWRRGECTTRATREFLEELEDSVLEAHMAGVPFAVDALALLPELARDIERLWEVIGVELRGRGEELALRFASIDPAELARRGITAEREGVIRDALKRWRTVSPSFMERVRRWVDDLVPVQGGCDRRG